MARKWIKGVLASLAGLLLLLVGIHTWSNRKPPEPANDHPTPAAKVLAQRRSSGLKLAKTNAECVPKAKGAFSCGECRDGKDCPTAHECLVNLESGRTECRGSECTLDRDCAKGEHCRIVARTSEGEPMRACVPPGTRPEGASCDADNGADPNVSCREPLLCVNGGCAPACIRNEPDEPSSCLGTLPCVKTDSGWGCTPNCKNSDQACSGGKVCEFLSVEDPISLCVHRVGKNCLGSKGGCAPNQECVVETNPATERTTFTCKPRATAPGG